MVKTVNRTYYNKKLGKMVTKTYHYDYKQKRGGKSQVLVGKGGKIYKDRINDLLNSITDPATRADAKARINQSIRDKERLTERSLASKIAYDKHEKMLINAGYTIESFENETGISFKDFSNPANWKDNTLTVNGITYIYKFNYEGNILETL